MVFRSRRHFFPKVKVTTNLVSQIIVLFPFRLHLKALGRFKVSEDFNPRVLISFCQTFGIFAPNILKLSTARCSNHAAFNILNFFRPFPNHTIKNTNCYEKLLIWSKSIIKKMKIQVEFLSHFTLFLFPWFIFKMQERIYRCRWIVVAFIKFSLSRVVADWSLNLRLKTLGKKNSK